MWAMDSTTGPRCTDSMLRIFTGSCLRTVPRVPGIMASPSRACRSPRHRRRDWPPPERPDRQQDLRGSSRPLWLVRAFRSDRQLGLESANAGSAGLAAEAVRADFRYRPAQLFQSLNRSCLRRLCAAGTGRYAADLGRRQKQEKIRQHTSNSRRDRSNNGSRIAVREKLDRVWDDSGSDGQARGRTDTDLVFLTLRIPTP